MHLSLCLNSVLDISNTTEGSQKKLFSKEEWKIICAQYGRKICSKTKDMVNKTEKINKVSASFTLELKYRA